MLKTPQEKEKKATIFKTSKTTYSCLYRDESVNPSNYKRKISDPLNIAFFKTAYQGFATSPSFGWWCKGTQTYLVAHTQSCMLISTTNVEF